MTSTMAIRSQASPSHFPSPYPRPDIPQSTSGLAAQVRLARSAGQNSWGATQLPAATFAATIEYPYDGQEPTSGVTWSATGSVSEYRNVFAITPKPRESLPCDDPFKVAFAPPSTPDDYQKPHVPSGAQLNTARSYPSEYSYSSYPTPGTLPVSAHSPRPAASSASTDNATTSEHSYMLNDSYRLPSTDHASMQPQVFSGDYSSAFSHHYQSGVAAVPSHSDTNDYADTSYSYQTDSPSDYHHRLSYPRYGLYDHTQSNFPDPAPFGSNYNDQAHDAHDSQSSNVNEDLPSEPAYNPSLPASTASSSSPDIQNASNHSPTLHTSNSCQPLSAQSSLDRAQTPGLSNASPLLPAVGSTESVRRRVGIMLRTQQSRPAGVSKHTSTRRSIKPISDGRRATRSPTSDDSGVSKRDSLMPTGSSSGCKDPAAKYKVAYERVKVQRDFYERAASSLVYQVRMLGGDPLQTDEYAAEGRDLDPETARTLITSLQRELDDSRDKLINTQAQLHTLRESYNGSLRTLARGFNGDYYSGHDNNDVPLSAAPTTVNSRSSQR